MKKIIILSLILVFFCCCFAFAEDTATATGILKNPLTGINNFQELVNRLVDYILGLGLVIAPLVIIIGGISFATAGGDTGKIEKAKTMLLYALIGLAVVLLAKGIITTLQKIVVLPSNP